MTTQLASAKQEAAYRLAKHFKKKGVMPLAPSGMVWTNEFGDWARRSMWAASQALRDRARA